MGVYKPCEICGVAGRELTPELYRRWGAALGQQVESGEKFIVGGDERESTPEFMSALAEGLCEAGLDVVSVGRLPTPMIHYARRRLQAAGCAIVTASHNTPEYNGLKWMIGNRPPTEKDVRALRLAAKGGSSVQSDRKPGGIREIDVSFDYVAQLQERWVGAAAKRGSIVLDPMHGSWAGRARRYLQAIFPHCVVSAIRDAPDPWFGGSAPALWFAGSAPDCFALDALNRLSNEVYQQRAMVGIAFDGDGDCIVIVDDQGVPLSAEQATWLLLRIFKNELRGRPFVYDLKFSQTVPEAARSRGATPIMERSDPVSIRRQMLKSNAAFGADKIGHYFFGELGGDDDALFTACAVIAFVAASGKPLSKWRVRSPEVCMTPDLPVRVKAKFRRDVVRWVRERWSKFPITEIDGVRVELPNGWVLVRNSPTEPTITFRFEGPDWESLEDLVWEFCESLPEISDHLWASYSDRMDAL